MSWGQWIEVTGIFHIVLAMKPVEGNFVENAIKHSVAGINIDGCRIGSGTGEKKTVEYPDIRGNNYKQGNESYADRGTVTREVVNNGRWPANIILGHSSDCKCIGIKKVKGSLIEKPCPNPEIRGHKWGTMQGNRGIRGYGDVDGSETVEAWECVEGCPVRGLDGQSGIRAGFSGGGHRHKKSSIMPSIVVDKMDIKPNYHNDIGGASRFFKQVKEME